MAFEPNVQVLVDAISTFSDADKVSVQELIYTDIEQGGAINEYHDVRTGITPNRPIPFGDRGEDWEFMKDMSGASSLCDDQPCDVGITLSNKVWSPGDYKCTIEYCVEDLDYKMKDFFKSERFQDGDDSGTPYAQFLADLVSQRIINSHWTKTYFAATSSGNLALSGHNGLFVQYAAAAPDGNANRIDITENDGANYAAQALTSSTVGFDTFNAMYEAFENNRKLRQRKDAVIKTTRALAHNYVKWLRDQNQVSCCERDPLTGIYTIDNLSIFGMPIKVVDEWDSIIDSVSDFNTGTAWVNPHRAVLTYAGNEPIGTGDATRLSDFQVKYDDYSEKTKIVAKYSFDAKVLQDDHFILAM